MKEWLMDPENQNLLKTMLIASGFGIGFFVLKGLDILKFPFQFLFSAFTTKISFTNTVWSERDLYNNFSKKILDSKKWMYRSVTPMYYTTSSDNNRGKVLAPGEGWFFCRLNGRMAFVRTQELNKEFGQQMLIHVTWFTRNNRRLTNLMLELKEIKREGTIVNYLSNSGDWIYLGQRPRRNLESVFYAGDVKENVLKHYKDFKKNKKRNEHLGIVSKSVKLFYGPPGTGKTSFGNVIATEFNKDLYIVNTANVSDDTFIRAIHEIPDLSNAIFLFEDIDNNPSLFDRNLYINAEETHMEDAKDEKEFLTGKKKIKPGARVSINTMLNFLDGVLTPENLDVMITTNHIEKLDPAIYRDSRVNLLQEIPQMDKQAVVDFIEFYYEVKLTEEELARIEYVSQAVTGSGLMECYQQGMSYEQVIDKLTGGKNGLSIVPKEEKTV